MLFVRSIYEMVKGGEKKRGTMKSIIECCKCGNRFEIQTTIKAIEPATNPQNTRPTYLYETLWSWIKSLKKTKNV